MNCNYCGDGLLASQEKCVYCHGGKSKDCQIKALQAKLDTAEKLIKDNNIVLKSANTDVARMTEYVKELEDERRDILAVVNDAGFKSDGLLAIGNKLNSYLTTLTSIAESKGGYACGSCQTKIKAAQAAVGKGGAG